VGAGVNTAFIERLNATIRQRLSALVRRTRTLARWPETLTAGMYVVGCIYNLCAFHHSLRLKLSVGEHGHHWVPRTPALAAGLTDHRWTILVQAGGSYSSVREYDKLWGYLPL